MVDNAKRIDRLAKQPSGTLEDGAICWQCLRAGYSCLCRMARDGQPPTGAKWIEQKRCGELMIIVRSCPLFWEYSPPIRFDGVEK